MIIDIDNININEWSDKTHKIRIRQLKMLNKIMGNDNHMFNSDPYENFEMSIKILEDYFNNPYKYNDNIKKRDPYELVTKISYLECLMKFLRDIVKDFPANIYIKYHYYYNNLTLQKSNNLLNRKFDIDCDLFLKSQNTIKILLMGKKISESIRIIFTLISMIDINMNNYGILRLSDLINITFKPLLKNRFSYLNIENGLLEINDNCTKNKNQRIIKFPMEFIVYLNSLMDLSNRKWLLINKNGEKYENTSTLYKSIYTLFNIKYYKLRHEYITYIQKYTSVDYINISAKNMGHNINTAIDTYNDYYEYDEED